MESTGIIEQIMGQIDIYTISGLAVSIAIIMEFLKQFIKSIKGYEDVVSIALTVLFGFLMKVFGEAFENSGVIGLMIQLALAAVLAQLFYDKIIAPLYPSNWSNKPDSTE